jgi:hypothetical protein
MAHGIVHPDAQTHVPKIVKIVLTSALVIFSMLSLLGTTLGIAELVRDVFSPLEGRLPVDPVWLEKVSAFAAALVIQGLVTVFWIMAGLPGYDMLTRFAFLFGGIGVSLISGLMAVALWLNPLGALDPIARAATYERAGSIINPGTEFVRTYNDFARMSQSISQTASREREEEVLGRSCDGPAVAPGEGPRWRLRLAMTTETSAFAAVAEELAASATSALDLPAVPTDEDLQAMLRVLRNLSVDPRIGEIRSWYDSRIASFESGTHRDALTGQDFECFDAEVLATLREARDSLEATTQLPSLAPTAALADQNLALQTSFGSLFQYLLHLVGAADPISAEEWERISPAVVIALMVELAIVLLAQALARLNPRAPAPVRLPIGRELDECLLLPLLQRREVWQLFSHPLPALRPRLLGPWRPTVGHVFLVPVNGALEQRSIAEAEAARWKMKPMPHCLPKDLEELSVLRLRENGSALRGATEFRAFNVPENAIKWWRQALVDINDQLLATGEGDVIWGDFQRQQNARHPATGERNRWSTEGQKVREE